MTYQPPQNILAAILQSRKQQGAGQLPAQVPGVDMSQPQPTQLPPPDMSSDGGRGTLNNISRIAGYDPSTTFGYQMPQGGGALGMISQMSGYAPNTAFGYSMPQQQQPLPQGQPAQAAQPNSLMSLLSSIFGGK